MSTNANYEALRTAIVRGDIAPDARLVEADVSASFEMSRGAVRTALIRLEQEGLVVREPHRGARVRKVSDEEAVEILQARAVLEGLAARQAAERIDEAGAARLQACLARQRELLDKGDLLGASDANADLHVALLELSGHGTVSVAASARVAEAAARVGVSFLRAPVSGNPVVVRSGNLTVIVSGPRAAFERAEAVIRAIGPNVYYVGSAEEARVVKLVLQVMIGGTAQLMAESLALGEAGGVSRAQLLEVMGNSAAGSPFVKYKTEPLVRDDYSATFTTAMMKKDIDLVHALAEDTGVALPLATRLGGLLEAAVAGSYAELDLMALFLALRGIPAPRVAGGGGSDVESS